MALFSTLFMMIQHWANFVEAKISNVLSPDKKVIIRDGDEKPRTCPDLPDELDPSYFLIKELVDSKLDDDELVDTLS